MKINFKQPNKKNVTSLSTQSLSNPVKYKDNKSNVNQQHFNTNSVKHPFMNDEPKTIAKNHSLDEIEESKAMEDDEDFYTSPYLSHHNRQESVMAYTNLVKNHCQTDTYDDFLKLIENENNALFEDDLSKNDSYSNHAANPSLFGGHNAFPSNNKWWGAESSNYSAIAENPHHTFSNHKQNDEITIDSTQTVSTNKL